MDPGKHTESITRQRIQVAATKIFMEKGLEGARMQDIAAEVGINKAMLHYYYQSKEKLFYLVFCQQLEQFNEYLKTDFSTCSTLKEQVARFVENALEGFRQFPALPLFLMNELTQRPEQITEHLQGMGCRSNSSIQAFLRHIRPRLEAEHLPSCDPEQILIHLLSLIIFPFAGKSLLQFTLELTEEEYHKLIETRKTALLELVDKAFSY